MSGQLKNDTEEKKLRVTLLSAGWKASNNGDLTTINRELAIQMAKHPYVEVSVFLPWCSEEDKKDADGYNVKLIEAVKRPGLKPVLWLASVPDGHAMDCVLGHGVDLGQQIPLIKGNPNYSHCKWIQVVHTSPEEIGMYKNISEGQKMQQTEIELCKMADQVVTIGPKLTDAYKHQLRKQDVFNLTPSILSEFSDVQQASDEERTFCVLVTESGDIEDFYVKGYDIAAKAIAELKDKSYQLKFASKQRGKEDELANKLLQCGIGRNQLMICSFDENRETLANLFSAVDIAILPSKTEGFGLSALEAISAGLPVLVSGNSGIAEALRKVPNGSQCIVDSEDPAEWARAIKAVRYKERNVRLAETRILRENYLQQFSWEKPCNSLVEKMYSLAFDQKLNINVGVEHMKLADHDAYSTASVSTLEPAGYQKASTASGTKRKRQSDTDLEDLELLQKKALCLIAINYLNTTPPQNRDERNEFKEYLQEMKVHILDVSVNSLVITVKCESLKSLEELWEDYSCGLLDKMVRDCFVTEKILKELNLAELKLKTTMEIEEYNAYKLYFLEKDALRGASSSEFHSISSMSESPHKQEELKKWEQKTKIVETEKLKGMLPLPGSSTSDPEEELEELRMKLQIMKGASSSEFHSIISTSESPQNQEELKKWKQKTKKQKTEKLKGTSPLTVIPTTGHGKELIGKAQGGKGSSSPPLLSTTDLEEKLGKVCVDLKMLRMEGSFPVLQFSTIDLEKKLAKLYMKLHRSRMKGTLPSPELVIAHLEEGLQQLLKELDRERKKGSLPPTFSTIEVELDELLEKFQEWRIEDALSSEFHSTFHPEFHSGSPQTKEQWEKSKQKTKIVETGKLKGTSPLIVVPTSGHGKELEEPWGRKGMLPLPGSSTFDLEEELEKLCKKLQRMKGSLHSLPTTDLKEKLKQVFEEIRMLRMRGSFSVLKLSTIDLEKKLAELSMKLQRLRMEGTLPPPELFTTDLEDELKRLIEMEGSSHSLFPIIDTVFRLRRELEKVKVEALENAMYLTIRSGLAKFDVSLPEELQNYVSYLLDESAKLHLRKQVLQPPRALEELREAMNEDELKTFLTIHIREGAWQVVLLFTDELPKYKLPWDWCCMIHNEDEDEDEDENKEVSNEVIYSSTSGILKAWPTEYDPSLATLCNAITNKDWKVTRLILSMSRTPDEGLKNLSTALTQSELYSLTLHDIGLQSQGLEHLCNALTSVNCRLTNLNVGNNQLGDVGIMHLCNALANVNCRLTNLNVSLIKLGDVEITRLCKALTSVDCTLTSLNVSNSELRDVRMRYLCNALTSVNCRLTNLNVSDSKLRDLGIKHLGNALANVNCRLTNLNVSLNKLGDVGIMRLCNALTSVDCTLTSLNVSDSKFGDVGIRHLCNALANVNCRLTNLNVSSNKLGDVGIMHLCDALTSVDCTLPSLNVSSNQLGDNGLKHLCDALTSRNCALTKLKVRSNSLEDRGIKELSEVLTSGFCALTSLDVSGNEFGDVGIKHLCKALTDTKCKLQSLNLCSNRYVSRHVTEDGKKYLSQMLTGTDWEDKGALRLSRSTTK